MADTRRHTRDDVYRTDARHDAQKIRVAPLSTSVWHWGTCHVAQKTRVAPLSTLGHLLGHLLEKAFSEWQNPQRWP